MIKIVKAINWILLVLLLLGAGALFVAQRTTFNGQIVLYSIPFILALLAFRLDSNAKTRWAAIAVNALLFVLSLYLLLVLLSENISMLMTLFSAPFLIAAGLNSYYIYRRHIKMKLMKDRKMEQLKSAAS